MGAVIAIAVGIAAALAGQHAQQVASAEDPVRVTVALQTDGIELRVAQGRLVVKLEI